MRQRGAITPNFATGLAVLVIALGLSTSFHLDAIDDHRAEWAQAASIADAQAAEQRRARMERAAADLCAQSRGPNSTHVWTTGGQLDCVDKRGRRVTP